MKNTILMLLLLSCTSFLTAQELATARFKRVIAELDAVGQGHISVVFPASKDSSLKLSDYGNADDYWLINAEKSSERFHPDKVRANIASDKEKGTYAPFAFLYSSKLESGKHYTVEWKNVSSGELLFDVGNIIDRRFVLDVKPIQDEKGGVSAFDVRWDVARTVSQFVEFQANTVAYLSTKSADSATSVSIRLGMAYNLSDKYYVPLSANAKVEASEDFARKDYSVDVGMNFSIEAMRLSISGLARDFTGNQVDAAPEPRIYLCGEYLFQQSSPSGAADVNIKRLNGQAFWSVPIQPKHYLNLSAKIWLEEKMRPRTFVDASYEYRVNDELSLLLKWINGELPPYFQKQANVSAGFSFKINKK